MLNAPRVSEREENLRILRDLERSRAERVGWMVDKKKT